MDITGSTSVAINRVLLQAQAIGARSAAESTHVVHVVVALWQDESRACEILTRAGVTAEAVTRLAGEGLWQLAVDAAGADSVLAEPDFSPVVREAVRAAQSFAGQLGRHAEVGTEHLLMGLIACDAELADWLEGEGVSLPSLQQQIDQAQGLSDAVIAADIQLRPVVRGERQTVRVDRILDAAANRCREGLRVVEDFVRFVLDDGHLSRLLKEQRHALTATLALLPIDRMLAARETAGDVGTAITTSAEQHRGHAADVVAANCKRVEESLRSLEEFSKTVHPEAGVRFEQLRYRFYTIEQAVTQTFRSRARLQSARLYLLVTDRLCPRGVGPVIREALQGGVDVVQLREKTMGDRQLLDLARTVREWTAASGALLIVNDRADIAAASDADGVHLGQDDLEVRHARQILGGDKLIGVSTHTVSQARQAVRDGADYLGVGPVFPSQTKEFADFPGLELVRDLAQEITRPWFALGGITESNIASVLAHGASRVAVSAAITQADDPRHAAEMLKSPLTAM